VVRVTPSWVWYSESLSFRSKDPRVAKVLLVNVAQDQTRGRMQFSTWRGGRAKDAVAPRNLCTAVIELLSKNCHERVKPIIRDNNSRLTRGVSRYMPSFTWLVIRTKTFNGYDSATKGAAGRGWRGSSPPLAIRILIFLFLVLHEHCKSRSGELQNILRQYHMAQQHIC